MAATGYTPIQLYRTATASAAPTAGNLADGELAINTNDGKLFYKDSSNAVQVIGWKTVPASAGGTGLTSAGANGNVLTSNGTTWTSAALPAGGLTYVYKTANYNVANKEGVLADTSGGAFTVTLPATPAVGDQVVVADAGSAWGTNNLTVGRNGSTIGGLAQDLVCDITGASVQLVYDGTTWEVYAQIGGNGGNAVTLSGVQTLTNKTINGANNTLTVRLANDVTGTLPVANGGTGASSLTANNVLLGNGTSAVQVVAPGTAGNVLTSNGTTWQSTALPATGSKTWTSFTSTGTYTVPAGVSSIRVYAFGQGGNGSAATSSASAAGGGGGGCAYGDLAVTAGQVVTITLSAGVATVSYASITRFTANPGTSASGGTKGTGGSASIHASVTNGGASTGGDGGSNGGAGGSSGSPLGNGYNGQNYPYTGGAGWGGVGNSYGGGGVGGASNGRGGGGAGGATSSSDSTGVSGGISRDIYRAFSDPLLAMCTAPGGMGNSLNDNTYAASAGPGGGGGGAYCSGSSREGYGGWGGLGGGGGGADATTGSSYAYAGGSTLGGGGGAATGAIQAIGGSPVYAGGGGAASNAGSRTAGTGGAAIVLIYA